MLRCLPLHVMVAGGITASTKTKPNCKKNMQVNMSEAVRECLKKCVEFAISKNAWISAIDYERDEEITMEEALEFLKDCKQ